MRGGTGKKTNPPNQDGQIQQGGGQKSRSCARETDKSGRTWTERLTGAAQDVLSVGVEIMDWLGGWGKRTIGQNSDGQAHGIGTGGGVGWRRNNELIGRMG